MKLRSEQTHTGSSLFIRCFAGLGLLLVLAGLAGGCGSHSSSATSQLERGAGAASGKFTLNVLSDSIYDSGQFALHVDEQADAVDVTIVGDKVSNLKGLYFKLNYDNAEYNPVSAQASDLLKEAGTVLELGVLDQPGVVTHGQVLANWDKLAGFSGSGVMTTVKFSRGPQTITRESSSVPVNDSAKAPVQVIAGSFGTGEILAVSVQYTNPGDYDQNGEVGIADLTPLGLHFGETVDSEPAGHFIGLPQYSVQTVIDGDGNGEINIADITPIGNNFGNDVLGGYNIYASADIGDVPASNTAPSTIVATATSGDGSVMVSGDTAEARLIYRYGQTTVPPTGAYFWARPVSGTGEEGTISQVFHLVDGPSPVLDLVSAPTGGTGTSDDPYQVAATVDHQISLTHGADGDVTTSPDAVYAMAGLRDYVGGGGGEIVHLVSVVATGIGELDESTGILSINDIYEGKFVILAFYGGRISNALNLLVPDPDNIAPTAVITADVTSGTAPWTADLSAENSTDTDGVIASYEWDINNDGTYEDVSSSPLESIDIAEGGARQVKLRVTDDDGASGTTTMTLQTTGWQRTVLDDVSDSLPADPMVQKIDGNPAVAYRRFNNLMYVRAADATGVAWNDPVAVPDTVTAQHICLRDLGGRPAMAYQRSGATPGIYYVLGNQADATSFEQVRITEGSMDHSPSLMVLDGNPALAYAWHTGDSDPYTLLYVRASDSLGNTGGSWDLLSAGFVVSGETFVMDKAALQITDSTLPGTDGRPCLMYIADNDQYGVPWRMCFTKATNASASTWSLPITISNNSGAEIKYPTVTSIVSRPRIAYFNPGGETVTYNMTPNLDGYNWLGAFGLPLGPESGRGYFPSLANVAGFPAMAYYDATEGCVRYVATNDPEGDTGWEGNDFVGSAGDYDLTGSTNDKLSLGAALGKPVIVYQDVANAELIFSTFYEAP